MTISASRPPIVTVGDRYRVIEVLGRGGMGVVYRVHDPSSGRELALKQAREQPTAAETLQSIAALEREFHLLTQLAHPRVVEVYDYGIDRTGPFYTMELLDSGDLKALAPLDVPTACALMLDVCSSLSLLHARRLVHRDVSARNVRCARDGHAKLIDFGAVVPMGPCRHTVGTPGFVAPEVVHHSSVDARTDLFSLGATLYYALTGRQPFTARTFAQLQDSWAAELTLPSRLAPGIPAALDALCVSLLRIDPAERPRSVYEVMQRLQTIGGVALAEPQSASQAYLATPTLIGREPVLRRFRQCMRNALHAQGGAIRIESAAGVGRTRVLEACVLEAKTLGAVALRATASAAETRFGVAQQLLSQLVEALPEASAFIEAALGFSDPRALPTATLDREQAQAALDRLFAQICQSHALLIAVDDVESADESSLGLLATLALSTKYTRLLLVVTCDDAAHEHASEAFAVLARQCSVEKLAPLRREETRALLASVFGNSLHVQTLSDRLFEISLGVARETLALIQHLIDHRAIRYNDGQWTLPRELEASQLPARTADVFAERIAALPPLARRIAEAQALLGKVLRHEDYTLLAPEVSRAARDRAVLSLQTSGIVQFDGELYSLRDRALSQLLCDLLDPEQRRARHLTLHALYRAQPDAHPYLLVHHLLEAGEHEQALDLLAKGDESNTDNRNMEAALRAGPRRLAAILERALELSSKLGRPAREAHELRRKLCGLSMIARDEDWFERIAPLWLAQLERDSGLADYRQLDEALPASARLQAALQAAAARYDASDERDRGYRIDEALKYLALYVMCSLSFAARNYDPPSVARLPGLLEPFTNLSPALSVVWQAAVGVCAFWDRRVQDTRVANVALYPRIATLPDDAIRYKAGLAASVASTLALNDALIGRVSAFEWIDVLEATPSLEIDALQIRAIAFLMLGDTERSDQCNYQAQLRALSTSRLRIKQTGWTYEIHASLYLRDLVRLRRIIDAIAASVGNRPGWCAQLQVALGYFELLRGDLSAARDAFEQAHELAFPANEPEPLWVNEFALATSGLVTVATERGELDQAVALGEQALQRCRALGADLALSHIGSALAFAFAKQHDYARACTHIDAVIAEHLQLQAGGIVLAHGYAVRAAIAVSANDSAAAERYIALTLAQPGGHKVLSAASHREPLLLRARPHSADSSQNMQRVRPDNPEDARVREALGGCADGPSRAARSLELLCALARAASGHLYLVDTARTLRAVATRNADSPDAEAQLFAQRYFAQLLEDENLSGLSQSTQVGALPGAARYLDRSGREHQLLTLTRKDDAGLAYVGLAVLAKPSKPLPRGVAPRLLNQLSALAAVLLEAGDSPGALPV